MSVLILLEGLGEVAALGDLLPVFDRLAATGRAGRLQVSGDPRFALFGRLAAGSSGGERTPPLGYAVALGLEEGVRPDPERIWCCLGFTHLYRKQNDLAFLSAERTGQTRTECWTLLEALLPDLQEAGWTLHPSSRQDPRAMPVLSHAPDLDLPPLLPLRPLEWLDGCSLRDCSPSGADARPLLQLLTVGQLLLARHPLNLERQRAGRLPLNTPWIWGVGRGVEYTPLPRMGQGRCWTGDPVLAGLVRASGGLVEMLDEQQNFAPLVEAASVAAGTGQTLLIHLTAPALLARHGLEEARQLFLQRVNAELLEPLTQRLAATRERVLMSGMDFVWEAGEKVHRLPWVVASGSALARSRRFWHRGRLGVGDLLEPDAFWSLCAA
ncbi:MAG: hypothetical protein H7836_00265 [Magnetococcus sp. YQC-3]